MVLAPHARGKAVLGTVGSPLLLWGFGVYPEICLEISLAKLFIHIYDKFLLANGKQMSVFSIEQVNDN